MIELEAVVSKVISAREYPDGKQHVELKVKGASNFYNELRIPNDGLQVDQQVTVVVLPFAKGMGGVIERACTLSELSRRVEEPEPHA